MLLSNVNAQNDFGPGYLVKSNKDTLHGFLEISMEANMAKQAKFKQTLGAAAQTFSLQEAESFSVDQELYRKIIFNNLANDQATLDSCFARQLVGGVYALYTYWAGERRFYLATKDSATFFLFNSTYTGTGDLVQQGNYSSRLLLFQQACAKLGSRYESVGYGQKEMADYFQALNNCIKPGTSVSFYHKSKTKMEILAFVGGLPVGDQSQFTAEALLRFSSPRLSKNTFLNVGLHYAHVVTRASQLNSANLTYWITTKHDIYSLPITIQYNFATSWIRPYLYAGFSISDLHETDNGVQSSTSGFQENFGFTLVAGIGIEVRIVRRLFLRADYRYESLLQFPAIGIAYQFK